MLPFECTIPNSLQRRGFPANLGLGGSNRETTSVSPTAAPQASEGRWEVHGGMAKMATSPPPSGELESSSVPSQMATLMLLLLLLANL